MEPHGLAREGGRRGQGLVRLCSCVARRTSAIAMKRGWLTTRASVIVTFSLLAQSAPLSARMSVAVGRPVPPLDKVRVPPAPCTLLSSQCARMSSCRLIIVAAATRMRRSKVPTRLRCPHGCADQPQLREPLQCRVVLCTTVLIVITTSDD
eukprot:scaffold51643_cov63-Phaeocystis_antarctica.AAC.5